MEEEMQSDQSKPSNKIKPLQLREQYGLNIADLAKKAKVGPGMVYSMIMRQPIARQQAEQILATISAETGQTYTLENVDVVLFPEEQKPVTPTGDAHPSDEERTDGLA